MPPRGPPVRRNGAKLMGRLHPAKTSRSRIRNRIRKTWIAGGGSRPECTPGTRVEGGASGNSTARSTIRVFGRRGTAGSRIPGLPPMPSVRTRGGEKAPVSRMARNRSFLLGRSLPTSLRSGREASGGKGGGRKRRRGRRAGRLCYLRPCSAGQTRLLPGTAQDLMVYRRWLCRACTERWFGGPLIGATPPAKGGSASGPGMAEDEESAIRGAACLMGRCRRGDGVPDVAWWHRGELHARTNFEKVVGSRGARWSGSTTCRMGTDALGRRAGRDKPAPPTSSKTPHDSSSGRPGREAAVPRDAQIRHAVGAASAGAAHVSPIPMRPALDRIDRGELTARAGEIAIASHRCGAGGDRLLCGTFD